MNDPSNQPSITSAAVLERFLNRERGARKQAELLLEEKSRQLYRANQELQQSAEALAAEAQRNKVILETAAEGIILFDKQGRIELLNPAAKRIFELSDQDCSNLNICDILPISDNPSSDSSNCFYTEPLFFLGADHEIIGRKKSGKEFPVEFVVAEFSHNGSVAYSGVVRDLTRRKFLEQRLAQAERLESVGQLAAGVAHEINTPIQFVSENTRFLKTSFQSLLNIFESMNALLERCKDVPELAPLAANVYRAYEQADLSFLLTEIPMAIDETLSGTNTVARIVRALNFFSHPGSQEFQKVDLNSELESTLTVTKSEWKYIARVETEFAPNLPQVMCIPGELNQVFLNLIVNAAHAIQARNSEELGTITIRTRQSNDRVIIDIADTGTGIPEAIRGRIFDPFFTTKEIGKGTGQGLSICYSVVESHRGKLTFDTTEGKGTTFHVELLIDPKPETEGKSSAGGVS
jgi:two-component system NtrC family sensor kinase